jgi:hypothetical protein
VRKINQHKYVRLQRKRERKRLKRLRKPHFYRGFFTTELKEETFKKKVDDQRVERFNFKLDTFLNEHGNQPTKKLTTEIEIPSKFSLEDNYDETILTLSLIRKSLLSFLGHKFVIDFTHCKHAEFSALFLLKVMLDEYLKELKRLHESLLMYKAYPDIKIQHSKTPAVNLALLANAIIKNAQIEESDFIPISIHNMITGRKNQKHYHENKKGPAVTSLRQYINVSLKRHGFELNAQGEGFFDGLISEILNNAEDHSLFDTWYAFANLFETKRDATNSEIVGEINVAFLNFGYSIYEGFEATKNDNNLVYQEMSDMCDMISATSGGRKFTRENLFTLYALQDGNSRLKHERESRGTGTMKFINSFLNLGDYQDNSKGYIPRLLIFSGSTMLKCDNTYKSFEIDSVNYLSLNSENDMTKAPVASHLMSLENRFPGTLITGKIYLNQDHLKKKINNGN